MRNCLLNCVEQELYNKSLKKRADSVKEKLLAKAEAKKISALTKLKLKAKSLFNKCKICGLGNFYCPHNKCCYDWTMTGYNHCPDCGSVIR